MYFPAKRVASIVLKRPRGNTHFYLSIGLSKKGRQDILTYKTKHYTLEVVWTPDPQTNLSFTPSPGLTEALTLIQSLYILLFFLMNA